MSSVQLPEIVSENFKNEWVPALPIETYHCDKTAISSSSLPYALKTARKWFHEWNKPYSEVSDNASLRLGSAAHCAILEPMEFDRKFVAMPSFGDMRSSTNRAKRDEWLLTQKKGAIIMNDKDIEKLKRIIDSLLRNRYAVNLIKGAAFEQTAYFRDPVTGLKCRFRPDIIRLDLSALPDLKTTSRDASLDQFSREIEKFKYHVRLAFYEYGVELIHGRKPEMPCWIVCETKDDFDVCVFEADIAMMERGRNAVHKALARIYDGVISGKWHGYQQEVQVVSLPRWTDFIDD